MLSYFDLRKGVQFILEGQPYEVLEFKQMGKAQDVVVAQTKIRNLLNGKTLYRSFHKGDSFLEAEVQKFQAKFLYNHREKFVFSQENDSSKRFELTEEQVGESARFLKPNEMVDGITFEGNFVNISLPVKVQLKVTEAPPGFKGNTAQGGTKIVKLETGATLDVPLFIETDDVVEVNTETGEYARRVHE
jgi:elongation factor P